MIRSIFNKIAITLTTLYVVNLVLNVIGNRMINTTNSFYPILTLIGWNVTPEGLIISTSSSGILCVIALTGCAAIFFDYISSISV